MNLTTDADRENQDKFLLLLQQVDPQLYLIKQALLETKLNPMIIPQIIRVMGNLLLGTGYGNIKIYMQARMIKNIVGEERVEINEDAEI